MKNNEYFADAWKDADVPQMRLIWNEVVRDGDAFPQESELSEAEARDFFAGQSHCGVARDASGQVRGLYILHPNNIGRCGHICNASYAAAKKLRGRGIGEKLVLDSLKMAQKLGFTILQFNAVVKSNVRARKLYERLGFHELGTVKKGFRKADGQFEDICLYWRETGV